VPKLPVVSAREIIAALLSAGFEIDREGSHTILVHPERQQLVAVPRHGGRDVPPGTLRRILAQAGMTVEEFQRLLK
jgi:predicted RNA binding protein YcfA (HicA-like mRNA interferase family)